MAFVHILVILFSFSFSSVYQNVSSSSMQHSFFIHIVSVLRKICAMDLIFLLSRDDHAFFMQPVTTLLFILCAHNVLCSAFIQQRGIHLQFIFPFHHFLHLLLPLSSTSIFLCNIFQWPRHAVDCIECMHPYDDGFMHLFYRASKTHHWNHIHSHFTSGNFYSICRFSISLCKNCVQIENVKEKIWNI